MIETDPGSHATKAAGAGSIDEAFLVAALRHGWNRCRKHGT
jgi:hypothetical protein